jgi:hypothetical protein
LDKGGKRRWVSCRENVFYGNIRSISGMIIESIDLIWYLFISLVGGGMLCMYLAVGWWLLVIEGPGPFYNNLKAGTDTDADRQMHGHIRCSWANSDSFFAGILLRCIGLGKGTNSMRVTSRKDSSVQSVRSEVLTRARLHFRDFA